MISLTYYYYHGKLLVIIQILRFHLFCLLLWNVKHFCLLIFSTKFVIKMGNSFVS